MYSSEQRRRSTRRCAMAKALPNGTPAEARTVRLVPDSISHDTVRELEMLLKAAKIGHVVGVAYVAMLKSRQFIADTTGVPRRNPVFALGMVRILDDVLV